MKIVNNNIVLPNIENSRFGYSRCGFPNINIQDLEIEDLAYIEKLRFGNSRVNLSTCQIYLLGVIY